MGCPYLLISMALRSHNIAITCDDKGERGEEEREGGGREGGRETGHIR